MTRKNIVSGLVFVILFISVLVLSRSLPEQTKYYPTLIGYIGLFLSVLLTVTNVVKLTKDKSDKEKLVNIKVEQLVRIMIMTGLLIVYILVINKIGYIVTTIVFMFGITYILGNLKKPVKSLIISCVFSITLYVLFEIIMNVSLPSGILI